MESTDCVLVNTIACRVSKEAAQTCGHADEMEEEPKHSRNDEECALSTTIPFISKIDW